MPSDGGGYGGYQQPTPVHHSQDNGVHADVGTAPAKMHVPFVGQTTLQTFRIGGRPCTENDRLLHDMGGRLKID